MLGLLLKERSGDTLVSYIYCG